MNLQLKKGSQLWLLHNIPLIIREKTTASGRKKKFSNHFQTQTLSFWKQLVMHLATHVPYLVDKQVSFLRETRYAVFS